MLSGGDEHCFRSDHFTASWLNHVTGFQHRGHRVNLTDDRGEVLAVLRPEQTVPARVQPNPKHDVPVTRPTVTKQTRRDLASPAPLPAGVQPASPQDLIGSWVAVGHPEPHNGYVEFRSNDNWLGSDGCNGYAGRYTIGRGGRLLVLDGPNGLVGCVITPAPTWVLSSARVARTSTGQLLLFNRHGRQVGALSPRSP